jgi:hypothetical protein
MGFRFRKSFKVAPGVRLNMGRTGFASMSVGPGGMKMNVGKRGVRTTVGIPGSGLSYTTTSSSRAPAAQKPRASVPLPVQITAGPRPPNAHKLLKTLGTLALAFIVAGMTHWLVGLLVAVVLLVMIFRSRRAHAAPAAMQVLVPTENAATQPTPQPVAPSTARWERLLLTTATKLCSRPDARFERLGMLDAHTEVTVLDRRPGWMFVQSDAGVEGWARDQNWIPVSV